MQFRKTETLAIKGIAILMMYIHHFYLSPERWAGYTVDFTPLTPELTVFIARFLKICVAIFVFLTGYGMTKSILKKANNLCLTDEILLKYTRHRLFSLLSNFIFIYLLVQIVTFPTGRFFDIYGHSGSSILYVIIDMLGLADLFQTPIFVGTWWYMSLCITLIIAFPLMIKLYKKYRWIFLLLVILLPRILHLDLNSDFLHWILAMLLGIYFADNDCFSNWLQFEKQYFRTNTSKIGNCLLFIFHVFLLISCIIIRQSYAGLHLLDIFDGIIPVYIIYFCLKYIITIPVLRPILEFLGNHSMNMFLTHTLIRTTYFKDFSYGFNNAWLNIFIFTLVTLLISICIEFIKKILHFDNFVKQKIL